MDIYDELGVVTFLNAYRPLTRLGGSTMPKPVIEAMLQASKKNVDLRMLQRQVGIAIAQLTHNEAAYVSCGAASGITLAIAGCMAGTNEALGDRLPCADGMKDEVLIQVGDRGLKSDVAVRCAGARLINVGDNNGTTEDQLKRALTSRTAALFTHDKEYKGKLPLKALVQISQERRIPVLVDAAF